MGAAYQTASKDVQEDLDRIRKEADSSTSPNARAALDAAINRAVAKTIKKNKRVQSEIQDALEDVIKEWDLSRNK